ncbi:unnamed protein product [Aphanomyces euteiches]
MEVLADISDLLVDAIPEPQEDPLQDLINSSQQAMDQPEIHEEDHEEAGEASDHEQNATVVYEPEISQWSSEEDEEEEEEEVKKKSKSRKKRKLAEIIDEEDLEEDTLLARNQEKERAKMFTADDTPTNFGLTSDGCVCINPLPDGSIPNGFMGSPEAPVIVHPVISKALKPHQVKGVRFLWSHISAGPKGFGCILADYMGLGKTLQVITTVHTFLNVMTLDEDQSEVAKFNTALILAPAICVRNWESEFKKWLTPRELTRMRLMTLESDMSITERLNSIIDWNNNGGVMVMGYEMYRNIVLQATGEEKLKVKNQSFKSQLDDALACLCSPGPDLIVLDEGHRIRDAKSKLVKALSHVETKRRVILTGYPIQNHMKEYWTMVNFARPNFLGTLPEFKNRFIDPIENGQFEDSSESDIILSRKRTFILTKELSTLVLRRDAGYLHRQLPAKHEYVLLCKLSPLQVKIYKAFLREGVPKGSGNYKIDVLGGYHISLAIVNHPDVLHSTLPGKETTTSAPIQQNSEDVDSDVEAVEAVVRTMSHRLSFAEPLFPPNYQNGIAENSGKMVLLMHILRECRVIGDRTTVFSQSISTLNAIENMLSVYNVSKKSYEKIHAVRIDGSTSQQMRFQRIAQFNDPSEDVDVILISTRAGGEGVNLCGGNRVVIFDVCWNPCHDSQSMCRSYRFGQAKPVYVYRLISAGTMEKKVYDLQVKKEGVSKRVVDNTALERKFQKEDVKKYFDIHDFKAAQTQLLKTDSSSIDMGKPDSDQVLASVLSTRSSFLVDWFEQESMFEENTDERCSELEQKEALKENEMTKAARGIRLYQVMHENGSIKRTICPQCNFSNPVTDEDLEKKSLTCGECETPVDLSDPDRIVTVNNANHPEIAQMQAMQLMQARLREQMTQQMQQQQNALAAMQNQNPQVMMPHASYPRPMIPYDSSAMTPMAQRPLPTRMLPFASSQNGANNYPTVINLEDDDDSVVPVVAPPLPPAPQYKPRKILFLRKGLDRSMVEALKVKAKSLLKVDFDVELTNYTTDLVSAMPLERVLVWLQLPSLPSWVTLRPVQWLQDQVAAKDRMDL